MTWKQEQEKLMSDWADKAKCYRWMHEKAAKLYSRRNNRYQIPIIIFSTIAGSVSIGQGQLPSWIQQWTNLGIGLLNLGIGIASTIYQFLDIGKKTEGHRIANLAWGKYAREIIVCLSKEPGDRSESLHTVETAKQEYDRLLENGPNIPEHIITLFKKQAYCDDERCFCDETSGDTGGSIDNGTPGDTSNMDTANDNKTAYNNDDDNRLFDTYSGKPLTKMALPEILGILNHTVAFVGHDKKDIESQTIESIDCQPEYKVSVNIGGDVTEADEVGSDALPTIPDDETRMTEMSRR